MNRPQKDETQWSRSRVNTTPSEIEAEGIHRWGIASKYQGSISKICHETCIIICTVKSSRVFQVHQTILECLAKIQIQTPFLQLVPTNTIVSNLCEPYCVSGPIVDGNVDSGWDTYWSYDERARLLDRGETAS